MNKSTHKIQRRSVGLSSIHRRKGNRSRRSSSMAHPAPVTNWTLVSSPFFQEVGARRTRLLRRKLHASHGSLIHCDELVQLWLLASVLKDTCPLIGAVHEESSDYSTIHSV
eukprot:2238069-Amphidinium_carterae.1